MKEELFMYIDSPDKLVENAGVTIKVDNLDEALDKLFYFVEAGWYVRSAYYRMANGKSTRIPQHCIYKDEKTKKEMDEYVQYYLGQRRSSG